MSRGPLVEWDRHALQVYGYCTLGAVLVLWTALTTPSGIHGLEDIALGGGSIIILGWVAAFIITGLPLQRSEPTNRQSITSSSGSRPSSS